MKGVQAMCVFVALLVLSGIPALGQAALPELSDRGKADMDGLLQRAVQEGIVPGVVAIVANKDQILYHGAFGLRDVANRKPIERDSIFRIASMTKPVTSVAVMMLQEQGKLKVDDPVSKYLPAYRDREVIAAFNEKDATYTTKKAAKEILIRHLLTNTSGFAYGFSNYTVNRLQEKTGKQPEELPLLYEPGSKWTYSGSTKILGQVVEHLSGTHLDEFFSSRIFKPLDMQETFYAIPNDKRDRVVTAHSRENGALVETPNPERIAAPVAGDGGLTSTASDYVQFLQMLLNKGSWHGTKILSSESVQSMTRNQIGQVVVQTQPGAIPARSNPFPLGAGRDKFGFGFQITASNKDNPNLRAPGSYSWAGIYNTHFWVDPQRRIAAVILMQVLPFYDEGCIKLYQDFEAAIGRNLR